MNKTLKLLSFNQVEIIGSTKNKDLLYPADIDSQEFIETNKTYDYIYQFFLNIFKQAKQEPKTYIIDFKCGFYQGFPIRWTYNDMIHGYQIINDLKITFQYALSQKSTIKLDVVSIINNVFTEFSTNYYFYFVNYNKKNYYEKEKKDIKQSILYDHRKQLESGKIYKALKRLYAYDGLTNNKTQQKKLNNLFNSDLGQIYKQKSSLETINLLLQQTFKKIHKKDIIYNLNIIQNNLPNEFKPSIELIKNLPLKDMSNEINNIIDLLNKYINENTENWIKNKKFNMKK